MTLYYYPGARSLAPHIALREADRSFELERVDGRMHRTASGADYRAINPRGDVPALELDRPGSMLLTENAAILQYVGDLVPDRHLLPPAGTFARHQMQDWLAFIGSEIDKQMRPLFHPDTDAHTMERVRRELAERFGYLSGVLVGRAYLLGETFTIADCYLFPLLRWCERFAIDLERWPNLDGYFARLVARPTVHAALAAEGLIESKRARRTA